MCKSIRTERHLCVSFIDLTRTSPSVYILSTTRFIYLWIIRTQTFVNIFEKHTFVASPGFDTTWKKNCLVGIWHRAIFINISNCIRYQFFFQTVALWYLFGDFAILGHPLSAPCAHPLGQALLNIIRATHAQNSTVKNCIQWWFIDLIYRFF